MMTVKMNTIKLGSFFLLFVGFTLSALAQERTLKIDKRYLNLPVKNALKPQHVKVMVGKEVYREFDIQLAESDPDFWVHIDMQQKQGKKATVQLEKPAGEGLDLIYLSDEFAGSDSLYSEKLRPQLHFTSQRGWNNDPNGMVYHNGEYHLYYQNNPYGWAWGNMHWGHAVSKDLVHWKQLPIALYPHTYKDMAFSGSAVIDKNNTSGFSKNGEPPLVAAFTSTGRGECIVYSLDDGRTFTEYANNPVLEHPGRDPKIFWYEPGAHWVMVVYDESTKENAQGQTYKDRVFQIHTSDDLKNWTYRSEIDGFYECPELFELPVDGDETNKKWVVYDAHTQYKIGSFDGKTFTAETPKYEFQHGRAYASQTFNNAPDGRRVQIAWGNSVISKGMPFNQLMLFPTELSLRTTEDGVRMMPEPVREIESLRDKKHEWKDKVVQNDKPFATGIQSDRLHIKAEFEIRDDFDFGLIVNGYKIAYKANSNKLNDIFMRPLDTIIKLEVIVDRTSIEIFGNDGRVYLPVAHISSENELGVEVYSYSPTFDTGNATNLNSLEVYELKSIWE